MNPSVSQAWPKVSIAEAHRLLTLPGSPFEMKEVVIRGVPTRVWKNLPPTLRDLFLAARMHGNKEYVVYEDDRATYEAWSRAALTVAHHLIGLGVCKGDRVAIAMRNLPEWLAIFFGAAIAGAVVTPLNAWWTGPELEYGLSDSGATVLFLDSERLDRLEDQLDKLPRLKAVYVARDEGNPRATIVASLEGVLGAVNDWARLPDRPMPDIDLSPDDNVTILYTSGTTGKPKGALGTHRGMLGNLNSGAFAAARNLLRRGELPPQPDPGAPQPVILLSVPLFHGTGCFSIMGPCTFGGGKLVLMRKWDAVQAMQLIEREKVSSAGGVPTIAWQLVEHPERSNYDLSSLTSISYGGAPSAPELVRKIAETWRPNVAGTGWGMTETSATVTTHSAEDYANRPDSCGPALPVCDLKTTAADGVTELPRGEVGELWARGPGIVNGYWNKPAETAATFIDGWVRTGDLARIDEEGFCFIVDRVKDMIIRGGENIYCSEIENVLYEHPAVIDAAVVAVPHRTLGEEPGAIVQLAPGAEVDADELRRFVAERLAAFKVPVKVLFWDEPLPRNGAGKIMKSELRKHL